MYTFIQLNKEKDMNSKKQQILYRRKKIFNDDPGQTAMQEENSQSCFQQEDGESPMDDSQ